MNSQELSQKERLFVTVMDSLAKSLNSELPNQVGLGLTLVHGNKTLLAKGYGMTSINSESQINEQTKFYIASATKPFTSLLALILDANGMVPLNTTLADFFPNTKWNDSIKSESITVRHLLSHTSGITNSPITWRLAYTGEWTHDKLVSLLDD
jgi:CubicO group peptidase (beta-lactamase class C family)